MKEDTVKKRKKVWRLITNKIKDILYPLIQVTNVEQKLLILSEEKLELDNSMNNSHEDLVLMGSNSLNHAIKAYAHQRSAKKKSDIIPIY